MLKDILLLFAGFLLGFAQIFVLHCWKRYKLKIINTRSRTNTISHEPEQAKLLLLHSWSYSHRLLPQNTIIQNVTRPENAYISSDDLMERSEKYKKRNFRGEVCYCVGYKIDHQDNIYGKSFLMKVADSDYSESLAIGEVIADQAACLDPIIKDVKQDPMIYFKNPVPSNISINVIIISEANNLLALRRSLSVATARGLWCIGAYETMEYKGETTSESDHSFHALAERCLREECGIPKTYQNEQGGILEFYHEICISSLTLSLSQLGVLVTAIVKLKNITEGEIETRISQTKGKYEHDQVHWLPLDCKEIKNYIENNAGIYQDHIRKYQGEWIAYTKHSLFETARMKDYDLFYH